MEHLELLSHALGPSRSKAFIFPFPTQNCPRAAITPVPGVALLWGRMHPFAFWKSHLFHGFPPRSPALSFSFLPHWKWTNQSLFWKLRTSHNLPVAHRAWGRAELCSLQLLCLASEEFLVPNLTSLLKPPYPFYTTLAHLAINTLPFSFPKVIKIQAVVSITF